MEETVQLVTQFIQNVGFPIAVSAFLMWERHTTMAELRDAIVKLAGRLEDLAVHEHPA